MMNRRESKFEAIGEYIARAAVEHPVKTILLALLVVGLAASGGRFLQFSSDYRVWFGKSNPQLDAFDNLDQTYSKDDIVVFALATSEHTVFTQRSLAAIHDITTRAWKLPFSKRVDSVTNFQNTAAAGDDLIVGDLVENAAALDASAIEAVRAVVMQEPLLVNRMIARDERVTAVNVMVNMPTRPQELKALGQAIREFSSHIESTYPFLKVYVTGAPALTLAMNEAAEGDMATLVPLMLLIMTIVMLIALRSTAPTVVSLLAVILAVMAAMGTGGFLGVQLTPASAIAPHIILTLAIANAIHIFSTVLSHMRAGEEKKVAIIHAVGGNFVPIVMTTLTSIVGYLALNFSDAPPFHDLGNLAALGLLFSVFLSFTLLPAMSALLPIKVKRLETGEAFMSSVMSRIAEFSIRQRNRVFVCVSVLTVVMGIAIPTLRFDDRFIHWLDADRIKFRADTDFINDHLTGMYSIVYSLPSGEAGGVADPDYLRRMEDFANWYRAQQDVDHVAPFTDVMKRLNRTMNGDDQEFYAVPAVRDLAAQYLLLYEMSLPFGLDLTTLLDIDKSASKFVVTLKNVNTARIKELAAQGEHWLEQNTPREMHAIGSGPTIVFSHISTRNIHSMAQGTIYAVALITVLIGLALRSFKYGLVSLVFNALPIIFAFGLWAILRGEAGMALAIAAPAALGIIDDDTVHFIIKFKKARDELRLGVLDAIRYAYSNVGVALVYTTVVLVAGFSVLIASPFQANWQLGLFTAGAITLALAINFLFVPSVLIKMEGKNAGF